MLDKLVNHLFSLSRRSSSHKITLLAISLILVYGVLLFWLLNTRTTSELTMRKNVIINNEWELAAEIPILDKGAQEQGYLILRCRESSKRQVTQLSFQDWKISSSGMSVVLRQPITHSACDQNNTVVELSLTQSLWSTLEFDSHPQR